MHAVSSSVGYPDNKEDSKRLHMVDCFRGMSPES